MTQKSIDSFIRWAGSKRQIRSILAKYWNNHFNCYIEPFLGSGNLFFFLQPQKSILSDINEELIDTYIQIRDNPKTIYSLLLELPMGEKAYYEIRHINPAELSKEEAAARFIYLNIFAFNGLYRTNLKGEFNVPFGRQKILHIPPIERYLLCSEALQNSQLFCCDFESTLNKAKAGDFLYIDPPYKVNGKKVFHEYDKTLFSSNDVIRLRNQLYNLNSKGVFFLLSYAKSAEAELLAEGFEKTEIFVRRNIAGFAQHRRTDEEWLITNSKLVGKKIDNEHN